jgi:hypothetical protein
MKRILRSALQVATVSAGVVFVYYLDASMESKANGPLLIAFAFVFTLQDSLFWLATRKFEDFLQSEGVQPSELGDAELRIKALKRHSRNVWLMAFLCRSLAIVCGVLLSYSDAQGSERMMIGLAGYAAVLSGFLLVVKTYALYWHADEEHSKRQVIAREKKAHEEEAKAIRAQNPTDWSDDPALSGYGEKVHLRPR